MRRRITSSGPGDGVLSWVNGSGVDSTGYFYRGRSKRKTTDEIAFARGPALSSELDPRFGRASYFVVVDADSGELSGAR